MTEKQKWQNYEACLAWNEKVYEIIEGYKKKLEASCSNKLVEDIAAFDYALNAISTMKKYYTTFIMKEETK